MISTPAKPEAVLIITPVYNDWASLLQLLPTIDAIVPQGGGTSITVCVIDDGSYDVPSDLPEKCQELQLIQRVEMLQLSGNYGHQRAIAVGLSHVTFTNEYTVVIVMDCDGEDRPTDLPRLLDAYHAHPNYIVVASRQKRSEGFIFCIFYQLYKGLFHLLIGKAIDFGNYVLLPMAYVEKLAYNSHLWNHMAATIMQSNLPFMRVEVDRGKRYAGHSHMNLVSLILHGLSAISVYSEVVFVRILLASTLLIVLALLGILVVVLVRLLTELAIPGWATSTVGFLIILLIQAVGISGGAAFVMLNMRSQPSIVPAVDTLKFVKAHTVLHDQN